MEKEVCVLCNKDLDIPRNLHIDFRGEYVEGVGQLCTECYLKLYGDTILYSRGG